MEASDPLAKEKVITPVIIMMVQKIFSYQLVIVMSPYPTVVIVVRMK